MLFGGLNNRTSCYSFSITSQQWKKLQDLPSKRCWHCSAVIGNSVFLVGGYKNSTIKEYNIVTQKFTRVSSMKRSFFSSGICRSGFGMCVYKGDSLLIAGGKDDNDETTNKCFVFNTNTKAIRDVGILNIKRFGNILVNFKGEIFCIGGYSPTGGYLNSIEVFDATTEEWKTSSLKLNIVRGGHQAVAHKQFIYVLGGYNRSVRYTDSIERIDVSAGKVEMLSVKLKHARSLFAASKHNNVLYIFGGEVKYGNIWAITNSTEVLNLDTLEIKEGVELPIKNDGFTACSF